LNNLKEWKLSVGSVCKVWNFRLALALRAKGRMTEAKEELVKCLEKDADFPEREEAEKLLKNWI
jgi:hypothetical protein